MATKNYRGVKFSPSNYRDLAQDTDNENNYSRFTAKTYDQGQDNLARYDEEFNYRNGLTSEAPRERIDTTKSYFNDFGSFDSSKYSKPTINTSAKIEPEELSGLDKYRSQMEKERGETPSFLKPLYKNVLDPIAYGLENTLYKNPLSQRTIVRAGETLAGKDSMKNFDGTTLEAKDVGAIGNFVADSAGTLLGMKTLPIGNENLLGLTDKAGLKASEFVSKKLPSSLPNLPSKILPSMARGAVDSGLGDIGLSLAQGDDLGTTLKTGVTSALGGAALFGLGKLGGEGLNSLKGLKKPLDIPKMTELTTDNLIRNVEQMNPIEPPSIIPKSELNSDKIIDLNNLKPVTLESNLPPRPQINNPNISKPEFTKIDNALPNNNINKIAVGGDITGLQKNVSQFKTNTLRNSPILQTVEAQKVIDDIHATYNVKSNAQSFNRAVSDLETNPNEVIERIRKSSQLNGAEDTVAAGILTKQLRENAEKTGDYSELKSWLEELQPKVTETAQSLQALSTWKKLTPEGTLMKAQQVVGKVQRTISETNPKLVENANEVAKDMNRLFSDNKLNDVEKLKRLDEIFRQRKAPVKRTELERILETVKLGGFNNSKFKDLAYEKFGIPTLTNNDIGFINDTMKKLGTMEDGRAKDIEFARVKQLIADKIPPSFAEKVSSLQRVSLLLNTKTMTRNVLGNVVMGGLENIKDIPGALIDKAVSKKFGGERTTLLPSLTGLKTQLEGGAKGFKETLEDYKLGVNTSPSAGQYDLPGSKAFRKGPLSKLEGATNLGLTLGDRPFWQGAYNETLRQQMKIKGIKEATPEMIEMAGKVADERTFQNTGKLVESFKKAQSFLNFGNKVGLGNFVMPFVKTPANILSKAIDYSPIGGINGLRKLFTNKGTQKEIVDNLSRSLTGSTLIATGYTLAQNGYLTGQANKDYDVASLEKQVGKTPYSIKVGNKYETIDWAQPAAIPLMIGADMFHEGKNQGAVNSTIIEAIKSGGSTLFDQSLLQGVSKLFGGYSQSGGKNLMEGAINAALQIPGQFVPSALKQGAQLLDNKVRDTYSPSTLDSQLNRIKTKVPGLSSTLQPKIDTMGREVNQFGGSKGVKYGFDALLNPGYNNKYQPNNVEKYILDLYEKSGQTIHFPRVAKGYIDYSSGKGKKDRINLTSEEKTELQKYIGEKTNGAFSSKMSLLQNKSPQVQAKELQKVLTEIYNNGEEYILNKRGIKEYKGR